MKHEAGVFETLRPSISLAPEYVSAYDERLKYLGPQDPKQLRFPVGKAFGR